MPTHVVLGYKVVFAELAARLVSTGVLERPGEVYVWFDSSVFDEADTIEVLGEFSWGDVSDDENEWCLVGVSLCSHEQSDGDAATLFEMPVVTAVHAATLSAYTQVHPWLPKAAEALGWNLGVHVYVS